MKFTINREEPPDTYVTVESETYLHMLLKEDYL